MRVGKDPSDPWSGICNCGEPAEIRMNSYAEEGWICLCSSCATQLARKLLEDLCDILGDRHG